MRLKSQRKQRKPRKLRKPKKQRFLKRREAIMTHTQIQLPTTTIDQEFHSLMTTHTTRTVPQIQPSQSSERTLKREMPRLSKSKLKTSSTHPRKSKREEPKRPTSPQMRNLLKRRRKIKLRKLSIRLELPKSNP